MIYRIPPGLIIAAVLGIIQVVFGNGYGLLSFLAFFALAWGLYSFAVAHMAAVDQNETRRRRRR